jgi:hypothetical protein
VATGHRSFVADGALPAISPDGRYLAYATGRRFTEMALRDLTSGRTTVISLRGQIGTGASLLAGQVSWLGDGTQIVVRPAGGLTAVAARSPVTPPGNSCGKQNLQDQQDSQHHLCLVLVSQNSGKLLRASRVYVPGNWGDQPLISGDVAGSSTLLLAGSPASRALLGVATVSAAGVTVQRVAPLPRGALPVAFAPGGDRILYLRGHGPALWVATIASGRPAGAHLVFTGSSKGAFGWAAW